MKSGYRLGSIMEFAGFDAMLDRRRLDLLRHGASHYLHEPTCEPVVEEWFGWRPMTYDSKPIIDFSPALANVLIAAGHNMQGVAMAPATGKLVAEMLGGTEEPLDELADQLEPEDGCLWICDTDDRATLGFTERGVESLKELIADQTR